LPGAPPSAQGVRLMRLGDDQFVSTVAKVKQEDDADEAESDHLHSLQPLSLLHL
jgi:hypothetical protein